MPKLQVIFQLLSLWNSFQDTEGVEVLQQTYMSPQMVLLRASFKGSKLCLF